MDLNEVVQKRAEFTKYLLEENTMRAVTRATIDALNVRKYREQFKHDGISALFKRYVDVDPEKAMELLEKVKAFEFEDPVKKQQTGVSDISELNF